MSPLREHRPYEGFRFFVVAGQCVSYTLAQDHLIILAVFRARKG